MIDVIVSMKDMEQLLKCAINAVTRIALIEQKPNKGCKLWKL